MGNNLIKMAVIIIMASMLSSLILGNPIKLDRDYTIMRDNDKYSIFIDPLGNQLIDDQFEPVNTNIIESNDPGFDYMGESAYYTAYFKANPAQGQVVKFVKNGLEITFQPMALNYRNDLNQLEQIYQINNVVGLAQNNQFIYPDAYGDGRDLVYEYKASQLKEKLLLNSQLPMPAQYIIDGGNPVLELNYILSTNSQHIIIDGVDWDKNSNKLTQNEVYIMDDFGNILYYLPRPYAVDNTGTKVRASYGFKKQGSSLYVSVYVPYEWLSNVNREYPIIIDPTTAVYINDTIEITLTDETHPIERVYIRNFTDNGNNTLYIDPVNPEPNTFLQEYAINPTNLNFTDGDIVVEATGNTLYKCVNWDFDTQTCNGDWIIHSGLVPGENNTLLFTPQDPGYGEVGDAGNLEIYRIQPLIMARDRHFHVDIIVYNPQSHNITITDVKDKWNADKIVDSGKLTYCNPACSVNNTDESVNWAGDYIIEPYQFIIFEYQMDANGPAEGTYTASFLNNDTTWIRNDIVIKANTANGYIKSSLNDGASYSEAFQVNSSTTYNFTIYFEETGGQKLFLNTQFSKIYLPDDFTELSTTDPDVSINGNMVIYDIPTSFKATFQTFWFTAKTPSQYGSYYFNATINGTDEGGQVHNDVFELLYVTPFVNYLNITGLEPQPNDVYMVEDVINITANVTDLNVSDNVNISTVWAVITGPEEVTTEVILTNMVGTLYNYSYTLPDIGGNHTIIIYVNDTYGNIYQTNEIEFVVDKYFTFIYSDSHLFNYSYSNGTLLDIEYNADKIQLENGKLNGTYISQVFDAGGNTTWYNVTWEYMVTGGLPDNGESDQFLDMTGNILLSHYDNNTADYSGNNYDGTNYGGTFGNGIIDNALSLNGSGAYIDYLDRAAFDFGTNNFTISIWVKNNDNNRAILHKSNFACATGYCMYARTSTTTYAYDSGGTTTKTFGSRNGNWHHLVVVRDSTGANGLKLYYDGVYSNFTTDASNFANAIPLYIGWDNTKTAGYSWDGLFDELAIFNRALSADEVEELYLRGIETDINFYFRACAQPDCSDGSWVYFADETPPVDFPNNTFRYAQYKVELARNSTTVPYPYIYNVTLWREEYDITPPATVTNLNDTETSYTWILWNWTNPADHDFSYNIIYLNGTNVLNTSNNYTNISGLMEDTTYQIIIHTVDLKGNINNTNISDLANTLNAPYPTINLSSPTNDSLIYLTNDINFIGNITGEVLNNCSLYTNSSGTFSIDETISVTSSGQQSITLFDLNNNDYIWNIQCCNIFNECSFAPTNYTFSLNFTETGVDWTPPGHLLMENVYDILKVRYITFLSPDETEWKCNVNNDGEFVCNEV